MATATREADDPRPFFVMLARIIPPAFARLLQLWRARAGRTNPTILTAHRRLPVGTRRIATFVDGAQWWETTNAAHLPTGLMRLCMQLDNFGGDISQGGQQIVDWARQYPLVKT